MTTLLRCTLFLVLALCVACAMPGPSHVALAQSVYALNCGAAAPPTHTCSEIDVAGAPVYYTDNQGFTYFGGPNPFNRIEAYGNTSSNHPVLDLRRARGTFAVPLPLLNLDEIGALSWRGYRPGGFVSHSAAITIGACEDWTATANGAEMFGWTTKAGTTADAGLYLAWRADCFGNFIVSGGLAVMGGPLTTFNTNIESGKSLRATGYDAVAPAGPGVEIFYTGGQGNLLCIDRTLSAYKDCRWKGANLIAAPFGVDSWQFVSGGHLLPVTANTVDIGSSTVPVRNITAAGTVKGGLVQGALVQPGPLTVGAINTCSAAGAQAWVLDADTAYSASTRGAQITGAGANAVPGFCDGAHWNYL